MAIQVEVRQNDTNYLDKINFIFIDLNNNQFVVKTSLTATHKNTPLLPKW